MITEINSGAVTAEIAAILPLETIFHTGGALLALAILVRVVGHYLSPRAIRHRRKIREARRILDRIQPLSNGAKLAYLREVDPFTFEELVLTAYSRNGAKIRRNKAYTGDGGIDGQVKLNGQWHYVQAKRYKSAIMPGHVQEFSRLCSQKRKPGLFVHTGRTGPKSKENLGDAVDIVSGDRLLSLLEK